MFVTKITTVAAFVLSLAVVIGGTSAFNYHLLGKGTPVQKTDKENIQGTWIAVSAEIAGKAVPPAKTKDFTVVITANKILFDHACTYKLDPTKTPKVIAWTPLDGPAKGESLRAIYELKGDSLKLCLQNGKGDPPTDFATKPGTELYLFVLKRVKK